MTFTKQELINKKNEEINTLKEEIRAICFEHIKEHKDLSVGDFIEIPSKNKFAIFTDLHTEDVDNCVIKTLVLTKLGIPSKRVTTFDLNDVNKIQTSIKDILRNNFEGEDFDKKAAIDACLSTQLELINA